MSISCDVGKTFVIFDQVKMSAVLEFDDVIPDEFLPHQNVTYGCEGLKNKRGKSNHLFGQVGELVCRCAEHFPSV